MAAEKKRVRVLSRDMVQDLVTLYPKMTALAQRLQGVLTYQRLTAIFSGGAGSPEEIDALEWVHFNNFTNRLKKHELEALIDGAMAAAEQKIGRKVSREDVMRELYVYTRKWMHNDSGLRC